MNNYCKGLYSAITSSLCIVKLKIHCHLIYNWQHSTCFQVYMYQTQNRSPEDTFQVGRYGFAMIWYGMAGYDMIWPLQTWPFHTFLLNGIIFIHLYLYVHVLVYQYVVLYFAWAGGPEANTICCCYCCCCCCCQVHLKSDWLFVKML